MEPASLQETSVILEHEMKDDPDSLDISEGEDEELDEKPVKVQSRKHICPVCGKSMCDGFVLKQHIKYIHEGLIHPCLQCDKTFKRKSGKFFSEVKYLRKHVASIHEITAGFKCDICNKVLKSKWSLGNHSLIHTGVNLYSGKQVLCPTCGKEFTTKVKEFFVKLFS